MILCVDASKIKEEEDVQRSIDLGDVVLNRTKYFESADEAVKEKYVPLDFCVGVRTVYSNKVAEIEQDGAFKYYVNYTNVEKFIHEGNDLIMYLAALGLMQYVDYSYAVDDFMVKHSTIQQIGLYNPNAGVINPIVYSHIIIEDSAVEQFNTLAKTGVKFVPITDMKREGNIPALLDKYVIVKGEK